MRRQTRLRNIRSIGKYLVCLVVFGLFLFPFFWMISLSFKPDGEIFASTIRLLPSQWTLKHYIYVWTETLFGRYFLNSLIVGSLTALITLSIALFAAYSFSRLVFRGRHLFLGVILGTQMLPFVLILIPMFIILRNMQLINTYWGLIATHVVFALPLSMMMLIGYFSGIPKEIEDAAIVDGCSRVGAIVRVLIPIIAPGLAAVAIFAFIVSWHEYMFALTLMRTQSMRTLPVGLALFKGTHRVLWGEVMAGSVITVLPVAIIFFFFQKFIVKGLTAGAVKG